MRTATGPARLPSMASSAPRDPPARGLADSWPIAEFRGPGIRRQFDDSPDDYDIDLDNHTRGFGVQSGRIILLGDGTEVLTDATEEEMFDEDKDLESQVRKDINDASERNEREGTPAPQANRLNAAETSETPKISESPSSTTGEGSPSSPPGDKPAAQK